MKKVEISPSLDSSLDPPFTSQVLEVGRQSLRFEFSQLQSSANITSWCLLYSWSYICREQSASMENEAKSSSIERSVCAAQHGAHIERSAWAAQHGALMHALQFGCMCECCRYSPVSSSIIFSACGKCMIDHPRGNHQSQIPKCQGAAGPPSLRQFMPSKICCFCTDSISRQAKLAL